MLPIESSDTIFHAIRQYTSATADNTHFGAVAVVTFVCSLLAAIFTILTYFSQRRTEKNTGKMSVKRHQDLLADFIRHLYRNLVITYTIRRKLEPDYEGYPSEEHLIKFRIPVENMRLDTFIGSSEYVDVSKLYIRFRNYNDEIKVVGEHLSNPNLNKETKMRDLSNMVFKVCFLLNSIYDTAETLWGDHVAKEMMIKALSSIQKDQPEEYINTDDTDVFELYDNDKSLINDAFVLKVYSHCGDDFFMGFFADICIEMGKNAQDYERVHIIKFK